MLQILINYYNEPINLISRLLKSIENQVLVSYNDYEVFLYSDGGSTKLTDDFLQSFKFKINHKVLLHRGVCATRNSLLDDSTAEYIMFCDADDYFHSIFGLYRLLKATKDLNVNIIGSTYEQESLINNEITLIKMERDIIRVHGKIFKRDYLIKNQIRFPDELPFSGDMYFLWQAYNLEPSCAWITDSFYVWSYNSNSLTRKQEYYHIFIYPFLIKNYTLLIENLEQRNRLDLRDKAVVALIQMMFLNDTNEIYHVGPQEYIEKMQETISSFIKKYGHIYNNLDNDFKEKMYQISSQRHKEEKNCGGAEAIPNWIQNILNN